MTSFPNKSLCPWTPGTLREIKFREPNILSVGLVFSDRSFVSRRSRLIVRVFLMMLTAAMSSCNNFLQNKNLALDIPGQSGKCANAKCREAEWWREMWVTISEERVTLSQQRKLVYATVIAGSVMSRWSRRFLGCRHCVEERCKLFQWTIPSCRLGWCMGTMMDYWGRDDFTGSSVWIIKSCCRW